MENPKYTKAGPVAALSVAIWLMALSYAAPDQYAVNVRNLTDLIIPLAVAQSDDDVDDDIDDDVEDDIEDDIDDDIEDDIDDDVEDDIDDDVEDDIEDDVEDDIEDDVEDDIEDDVEDDIEDDVEDDIESEVEDDIEDDIEADVEDDIQEQIEDDIENEIESLVEQEIESINLEFAEDELEEVLFEFEVDENDFEYVRGEWLVLADRAEMQSLIDAGYELHSVRELPSIGKQMGKLIFDSDQPPQQLEDSIRKLAPNVEIDRNYLLFEPSTTSIAANRRLRKQDDRRTMPAILMPLPGAVNSIKIGVIDTDLDINHPVFENARIVTQAFVPKRKSLPKAHGTSVVSALVGQSDTYRGLLPGARIFSGSVFFDDRGKRRVSTTENIGRAIDWMVDRGVQVVNMSFTGPYSRILDVLTSDLEQKGIQLVAAAGNDGPGAPAAYPAAYSGVIAVTAVAENNVIYRLANRGEHIMFAAPGVGVLHAAPNKRYSTSSGTSMAAPFVTAILAAGNRGSKAANDKYLQQLIDDAIDLGPAGFDPIFGHGLIRPPSNY